MSPHGVIAIPMSVFCATATRSVNRAPVSSINILRWHGILRQQNLCPHLPRLIDMIVYKRLFGIDSRLLDRMAVAICPPFVTQVWQVDVLIFMLQSALAAFTPTFQSQSPMCCPKNATISAGTKGDAAGRCGSSMVL